MIKKKTELGSSFRGPELRPIKHRGTQFDDGTVQRVELALEAESLSGGMEGDAAKQLVEELFEEFGRTF